VAKSEGRRQLGRRRHRWNDNIKMDFRKIEWGEQKKHEAEGTSLSTPGKTYKVPKHVADRRFR
jgi:hypothetical protein